MFSVPTVPLPPGCIVPEIAIWWFTASVPVPRIKPEVNVTTESL